jgi:DNA-binding protein YbaB
MKIKFGKGYITSDTDEFSPSDVELNLEEASGIIEAVVDTIDPELNVDDFTADIDAGSVTVILDGFDDGEPVAINIDVSSFNTDDVDSCSDHKLVSAKKKKKNAKGRKSRAIFCSVEENPEAADVTLTLDAIAGIAETVVKVLDDGLTVDDCFINTDEQTVNVIIGGTEDNEPVEVSVDVASLDDDGDSDGNDDSVDSAAKSNTDAKEKTRRRYYSQ